MVPNTLFIGQNSIELPSVDSTNNYVLELLKKNDSLGAERGCVEGTLVWTHDQTSGRGQRGNTWLSKPLQNLTMSLVLYPQLPVHLQFYVTKITSLAVAQFVEQSLEKNIGVSIKWPNDIFVKDQKVAGILIENSLRGENINSSVIGIGLNVNQTDFENGLQNASSLKLISGKEFKIDTCIKRVCELIEPRYLQLKAGKYELLDKDYHAHLHRLNKICNYSSNGESFDAMLIGVNESGKLLLKHENEEIKEYNFKEVAFT